MCYICQTLSLLISQNWINRFVGLASFESYAAQLGTLSPYYMAFLSPETHSFILLPSPPVLLYLSKYQAQAHDFNSIR